MEGRKCNNIFKNASFGSIYYINDGRRVLYIRGVESVMGELLHYLILEDMNIAYTWYNNGELTDNFNDFCKNYDGSYNISI